MKKLNFFSQLKANYHYLFFIASLLANFMICIVALHKIDNYKYHDSCFTEIFSHARSYQLFEGILFNTAIIIVPFILMYFVHDFNNDEKTIAKLENEKKALKKCWHRLTILEANSQEPQKILNNKLRIVNDITCRLIDKLREVRRNDLEINDFLEEIEEDYDQDYLTPDDVIPIKCLECKYYSYNKLLKCAVNPNLPDNCEDFEAGEQIDDRYVNQDPEEDDNISDEFDRLIDADYVEAATEANPHNTLIGCSCGYPFFVSLEYFRDGNSIRRSYTYFTCLLNDNNREVTECPNCNTHLI